MELELLLQVEKDVKLHEYLYTHSMWYRLLNRDSKNYTLLEKEFKAFKHQNTMNKVNDTIDNIELLTNVIKMVE